MLKLTLVTPTKKIATDLEIEEVFVPGYRGELNILPGHAALVTTLSTGVLKWRRAGLSNFEMAAISWGYCEVFNDDVSVLAETAETAEDLDLDRAQEAMKRAQEMLAQAISPEDIAKYKSKLDRSMVRLEVAKETHR